MSKVIIGMDYGHGEFSALCVRDDQPNAFKRLELSQDQATVIPTAIWYGPDGEVQIGREATSHEDVILYFKTAPGEWYDENGDPVLQEGHAVRDIMRDFLRECMKNVLKYNTDNIRPDDELMVIVGAPSSSKWHSPASKAAYRKMIQEAVCVHNVDVVPESRAAIFSAYRQNTISGAKGDASRGIAVLDLGSLTADFTYMRTATNMIERSWVLGAHEIERMMMRHILRHYGLTENDVGACQRGRLYQMLREQKEMYYSGTLKAKKATLEVDELDEAGRPVIYINKKGVEVHKIRYLMFPFEDEDWDDFMDSVVSAPENRFPVSGEGKWIHDYTWKEACRAFMEAMRDMLTERNLSCSMVVLTGGASKMHFVQQIAAEVFGENGYCVENEPSFTVARGLCITGEYDKQLKDYISQYLPQVCEKVHETYLQANAEMAKKLGEKLSTFMYGFLQTQTEADTTIGALEKSCKDYIEANEEALNGMIKPVMDEQIDSIIDEMLKSVMEKATTVSQKLYGGKNAVKAFTLPQDGAFRDQMTRGVRSILEGNGLIDGMNISNLLLDGMLDVVSYVVVIGLLIAIGIANPVVAALLGFISGLITEWIKDILRKNKKMKLRATDLQKALEKLNKPGEKKKYEEKIEGYVQALMKEESDFGKKVLEKLDGSAKEALTTALETVALKSFADVDSPA